MNTLSSTNESARWDLLTAALKFGTLAVVPLEISNNCLSEGGNTDRRAFLGAMAVAGDPEQPIQHVVHRIDWASLSDEEIEAIEAFARAAERRHQIEQGARPQLGTDR